MVRPHIYGDTSDVNVDQQRQLQTRMLLQQQLQNRTHQSMLHQQQQRRQPKAKPSKRIIAINLPSNLHTIESVTTTFYPYGEILLSSPFKPYDAELWTSVSDSLSSKTGPKKIY